MKNEWTLTTTKKGPSENMNTISYKTLNFHGPLNQLSITQEKLIDKPNFYFLKSIQGYRLYLMVKKSNDIKKVPLST